MRTRLSTPDGVECSAPAGSFLTTLISEDCAARRISANALASRAAASEAGRHSRRTQNCADFGSSLVDITQLVYQNGGRGLSQLGGA